MPTSKPSKNIIIAAIAIALIVAGLMIYNNQDKPEVSIGLPDGKTLTIDVDNK